MQAVLKANDSINIDEPSFSKEWWDHFYRETEALTKPRVFKDVLGGNDIDEFKHCVLSVIRDVSTRKIPNGFRVSIGGTIEENNKDYFYQNPPLEDEGLIGWSNRVFKDKKFGVILNSSQNYDRNIKKSIFEKFSPLLLEHGVPPNGLEITLFFGNYGYTPLGFHLDPVGHKVTHLHLGPGRKQMFLIDKHKFEVERGLKTGYKEFEKLVPDCEMYEFGTGDIFFMPVGYYHVGNTEELSFGITVWHIEPSVTEFSQKLITDLAKKIFIKEDDISMVMGDCNEVDNVDKVYESMEGVLSLNEDFENLTLKESLESLIREHRYKLFSNGFFYGFLQNQEGELPPIILSLESVVTGVSPYKIYYIKGIGTGKLFVQGKKIEVPNDDSFHFIVDKINSYNQNSLREIFYPVLNIWEEELILYISNELYRVGGLNVVRI